MWLIEYNIGKDKFTNHYLAGKAPFKLDDYILWYKKLKIERGTVNPEFSYDHAKSLNMWASPGSTRFLVMLPSIYNISCKKLQSENQ